MVLSDAILSEPNLEPFLNTVVLEVRKDWDHIAAIRGYTLASEIWTTFQAPLFVDATGDGAIGALADVEWRQGRESRTEFNESMAPEAAERKTMGDTVYMALRRLAHPVEFRRPSWASAFSEGELACIPHTFAGDSLRVGFVELGGEMDTIFDNEKIKLELWRLAYGIWDHFKNHRKHREDSRNLDIEWMAIIPGKRESRRLVGPYLMKENDVHDQTLFSDAVAYGGGTSMTTTPKAYFTRASGS